MKNFPIEHEGKTYWIARNIAVACFVFTEINGETYILANQRGEGVPDFRGFWNCPCGYLDYNETTEQAAIREVYEETGIKLEYAKCFNFNDKPDENLQNVTFRYISTLDDPQIVDFNLDTANRGGENNEVQNIAWIPIDKINEYKWAFNHDKIISEIIDYVEGK